MHQKKSEINSESQLTIAITLETIVSIMKNNKFTGYQLYNKDAKKRTKQNGLPNLYPELPDKQYDIIYADPPWHYNGKLQFDKTSTTKEKLDLKMAKIVRMELQNIITIKE